MKAKHGAKKADVAKELCQIYGVSMSSVHRIMDEGPNHNVCLQSSRKAVGGRKNILSPRKESLILRQVGVLRDNVIVGAVPTVNQRLTTIHQRLTK